jgi:hypothetical protein
VFGYKHKSFTILVWYLLLHCLTFLFVVFIVVVLCPISYSTCSLLGLYFPDSSSFIPNLSKFTVVFDSAFVDSNLFEFFHYYSYTLFNIKTFHAIGCSNLTIMVDKSRTIVVSEHCIYVMFTFQPSSLHIFKDVLYDYNNFVSSSFYKIPMTSSQGRQWVVGCGHYCIVGDNLAHNSQETIMTWWHEPQVLWLKLWSKNSKLMILSFNVLMFLRPLFSLNCLVPWWVKTWHNLLHQQNRWKAFFSLETFCRQNHPPMWGVFSLVFLAHTRWCCQYKPPTSCGPWIMTISLYEKSNSCQLLSMGTSCLNCYPSIWMFTTLPKWKAWIESIMAMLGVSWSKLI